jgi:hypothetical protein
VSTISTTAASSPGPRLTSTRGLATQGRTRDDHSLDDFVRAQQQRLRNREAKGLGGLEIDE